MKIACGGIGIGPDISPDTPPNFNGTVQKRIQMSASSRARRRRVRHASRLAKWRISGAGAEPGSLYMRARGTAARIASSAGAYGRHGIAVSVTTPAAMRVGGGVWVGRARGGVVMVASLRLTIYDDLARRRRAA